jgi:RHS repeat-associated protein
LGSAQYFYDGLGNRLKAVVNGATTKNVYDAAGNLLAQTDGNGNITQYYLYGAGLIAMQPQGGGVYCYHFDATGNTVALTDQNQNIANTYAYKPYGELTSGQTQTVTQPFTYVGQYGVMTENYGYYNMRARYYDSGSGRFASEDPLGFGGGDVNLSAYVRGNPVNGMEVLTQASDCRGERTSGRNARAVKDKRH